MTEHVVAEKVGGGRGGRGMGTGFKKIFFLNQQCYIAPGFFPPYHLVSKPFAPTILIASVKLTDVLELHPK